MPIDHAANATRFREHAEECRAIARMMKDEGTRTQYLSIAEAYEQLAANEDQIARNMEEIRKNKGGAKDSN